MEHRELTQLKVNPNNPRGEVVVDVALQELAQSILEQGVLQPILITPDGTIVAGHRRAKACELVGIRSIPVVVRELSESQQIQIMLIENLQREDLTALQTAKAYKLLCDKGLSIRELAKAVGYSPESVSRHLNILQLPKELHSCFDGEYAIPLGGIKYLLELKPADRLRIGKQAAENRWLVSSIAHAVAQIRSPQPIKQVIREVVKPNLSKPIVREHIPPATKSNNPVREHLNYAITTVERLLAQSPDEAFSVRYERWLNVLRDDLEDLTEKGNADVSGFRGSIDLLHRQPQGKSRGWKTG